jgi:hypothetical protein
MWMLADGVVHVRSVELGRVAEDRVGRGQPERQSFPLHPVEPGSHHPLPEGVVLVLGDHADGPDGRVLHAPGEDVEVVERRIAEELGNQSRVAVDQLLEDQIPLHGIVGGAVGMPDQRPVHAGAGHLLEELLRSVHEVAPVVPAPQLRVGIENGNRRLEVEIDFAHQEFTFV